MSANIWKELLILIVVFGMIWIGFSYYSYDLDAEPFGISLEKEEEISDFMVEYLMQDFQKLGDPKVDSAIQVIFDRLTSNMDSITYEYQLHIIDEDQINAFTSLNGNIYLFTGLIKKLETPEELAIILAHEIGHAENKHVVEKLIKTLGIEALFSILSGGDPVLLSEIAKLTMSTTFDRKNEEEADEFAMNLAYKSNINPHRLGQFFLKLKAEDKGNFYSDLEFIRTHPMDNDRIKKSADFKLSDDFAEVPIMVDWQAIKELI